MAPRMRLDRWPRRLAEASIERPVRSLVVLLVVTLLAAPGLLRSTLRTDGHALVPPREPAVLFDDQVREQFELRDPLVVLIETRHPQGIFHPDTLALVRDLSATLARLPEVGERHVTSLATETRDRVYPGTLDFRPFLDPFPEDLWNLEILRGDVAAVDLLEGTLVSADRSATAILVGVPPLTGDPAGGADRTALYHRVVAAAEPFDDADHRIAVVGAPAAEALLGAHILEDLTFLVPLAMLVIAVVVGIGCRRPWGVALALGEVGACLVFTFGVMGWLGVPVYLPTAVLPVILTTLGLADEIHLFWHYQKVLDGEPGPPPAGVRATFDAMTRPIVLTSITTSLAFLSFLASSIVPVQAFGLFAALGILFCLLWSVTVIPASLVILGPERLRRPRGRAVGSRLASWTAPLLGRPTLTLGLLGLLTLAAALGLPRLVIQDSWIDGFAPGSPFRQATDRFNRLFHGSHILLVHLELDPPKDEVAEGRGRTGPLLSPEILTAVEDFEEKIRRWPGVGGVLGPASHLKTVSYLWLGRNEDRRRIPETPRRVDLALERFDTGRGPHRRREVFHDDLSRGVVTIFLKDANYRDTAHLMEAVRGWHGELLEPRGSTLGFAGDVAVSQAMIPAIVRTQVTSLLLALGGAFLAVWWLTGAWRTGLLAVAPASVAVLWVFGVMGWTATPLGVATSMFCAITLGVGVDHAIHFLESVRRGRARPAARPVAAAVAEAGPAIVADAVAIAAGFGLLAISQVPANARLGWLVAGALVSSAILTLLGLGAWLRRRWV